MLVRYCIILSILTLSSCTLDIPAMPDKSDTGVVDQTGNTIITGSSDHQDPLVENLTGSGDAYYPIFHGLETKVIRVKHTTGVKTKIAFINSEAKSMHVIVSFPEGFSGANLRLSQIVMPDGNMDGPFGTDTKIELTQFGGYELLFHENMMAGDPWSGDALITISLLGK